MPAYVPLLGFVAGFLGSVPIAGPIAVLVIGLGTSGHAREARALAAGAALAEAAYATLALLGATALIDAHPWAARFLHVGGGLMLVALGLALVLIRRKPAGNGGAVPRSLPRGSGRSAFLAGLGVAGLNPTLLVTWTGVTAVFSSLGWLDHSRADALGFGLGVAGGIIGWFLILLAVVDRVTGRVAPRALVHVQRVAGIAVVALGVWLLAGGA